MFRYAHVCRHMHAQSQSKRIIDKTHTHIPHNTRRQQLFWCIICQILGTSRIRIPLGSVGLNFMIKMAELISVI